MTWSIANRTALITGGNSGIGKAIAVDLARQEADVVITVRDAKKGDQAAADIERAAGRPVEVRMLDLADLESVRRFADGFCRDHDDLAVLVNNAGGVFGRKQTTVDGFERTLGTNHLGPFLLTNLLTDLLKASAPARIVNVASSGHAFAKDGIGFDDLMFENRKFDQRSAYGQSKLANILHVRELNRRLSPSGVTAYAIHPGLVATDLGRGDSLFVSVGMRIARRRFRTPEQGAETAIFAALDPDVIAHAGEYFEDCAPTRSSRHAKDDDQALRLWDVSERLTA
jgi:NAD(P)-dependent dehydrogenase (short-subunit alcohol dehydrogenase family)